MRLALALSVALPSLAAAQEIGPNDFRISFQSGTGNAAFDGQRCAIAHNTVDDEYLVVWSGDTDQGGLADNELEIYGQNVDSAGGLVGATTRSSTRRRSGVAR